MLRSGEFVPYSGDGGFSVTKGMSAASIDIDSAWFGPAEKSVFLRILRGFYLRADVDFEMMELWKDGLTGGPQLDISPVLV